jgi:hypothetical protein
MQAAAVKQALITYIECGTVLRYMGDLTNARRHIERMLSRYVDPRHQSHTITIRFMRDQRVAGEVVLALIVWLQGFVALWIGDLATAERYVSMLLDHSAKLGMAVWQAGGRCLPISKRPKALLNKLAA